MSRCLGFFFVFALFGACFPALAAVPAAREAGRAIPHVGSEPPVAVPEHKGPLRATVGCESGIANFPFLKPWVERLENFIAPVETGTLEGSLFYAVGVTTVSKGAEAAWRGDAVVLPLEGKRKGGRLETAWLGEVPATAPGVEPGPGYARVGRNNTATTTAKESARKSVIVGPGEPALANYGAAAIHEAGKIGSWARLWSLFYSPMELALLETCADADCKIKFDDQERKVVTGASHQYRLDQFRHVIQVRLADFQKLGRVQAYEGTHAPLDWQDLPIGPLFPAKLGTHFWLPHDRRSYGYEYLDAEPGHHKPVTALFNRQCEKRGEGAGAYTVCTDLVLYNNHYFDFWARIVLFFPWCDAQVAMAYETVDIDQIKASRMARVVFGGEMRRLQGELLETRLKHLHMLGF